MPKSSVAKKNREKQAVPPRPPLKWAGGKTWAVEYLSGLLPERIDTYHEPMVGGGALFFALANAGRFRTAILSDTNRELMATYAALQDERELETIIVLLRGYRNDKDMFLRVRAQDPTKLPAAVAAARMIFLNKTGFNGLYRVNTAGKFNVPFGKYANPTLCDESNLRAVHAALTCGEKRRDRPLLMRDDYPIAIDEAKPGDAVYFDPPYLPVSKTSNFTGYVPGGWKLADHERLAACFADLAKRGVAVLLSNSDTETTRALYRGFDVRSLKARRSINSKGTARGLVGEIVVVANCRGHR
jgi:DNA adenine methylase